MPKCKQGVVHDERVTGGVCVSPQPRATNSVSARTKGYNRGSAHNGPQTVCQPVPWITNWETTVRHYQLVPFLNTIGPNWELSPNIWLQAVNSPNQSKMSLVPCECPVPWYQVSKYQVGPQFSVTTYTVTVVLITVVISKGINVLPWLNPFRRTGPKTRTVTTQSMCTYKRKMATPRFEWIEQRGEDGAWSD